MSPTEHRDEQRPDRRHFPRGGRRAGDRPGSHPYVLVADGYPGARVPCARYLRRFGFHVEEAADGGQVLALVDIAPPHVIVVELGLPQLPAARLTRRLAQHWRTRDIPVIVVAGDTAEDDEPPPPTRAGMLVKPFPLATMLEEIRRVIRTHTPLA